MSGSRHFTVVDDWVILNQEINSTEFRVYAILRAAVLNEYGGIPKSGLRVTAGWVAQISGDLFSRTTAHRALRGLAAKGVLGRLNDPKEGGEGAEFEFIVHPPEGYEGVTNVQAEMARIRKKTTRSIRFDAVEIDGNPRNGLTRKDHVKPSVGDLLGQPAEPESGDEDPGFDTSALDPDIPQPDDVVADLTMNQQEFATELETLTSRKPEGHLRLMRGQCVRVAEAVRPALERGWDPKKLAQRMAAELNPKIHSPEKLLLRKAGDLGDPPKSAPKAEGGTVVIKGQAVDLSNYDPGYGYGSLPAPEPKGDSIPDPVPSVASETKEERLARLARKYNRN